MISRLFLYFLINYFFNLEKWIYCFKSLWSFIKKKFFLSCLHGRSSLFLFVKLFLKMKMMFLCMIRLIKFEDFIDNVLFKLWLIQHVGRKILCHSCGITILTKSWIIKKVHKMRIYVMRWWFYMEIINVC